MHDLTKKCCSAIILNNLTLGTAQTLKSRKFTNDDLFLNPNKVVTKLKLLFINFYSRQYGPKEYNSGAQPNP